MYFAACRSSLQSSNISSSGEYGIDIVHFSAFTLQMKFKLNKKINYLFLKNEKKKSNFDEEASHPTEENKLFEEKIYKKVTKMFKYVKNRKETINGEKDQLEQLLPK